MIHIKKKTITVLLFSIIYSQNAFSNNYINSSPYESIENNNHQSNIIKSSNEIIIPHKISRPKEHSKMLQDIEAEIIHKYKNNVREFISDKYFSYSIDKNNNLTLHLTEKLADDIDKHLKLEYPGYNAAFSNTYAYIIDNQEKKIKKSIIEHLSLIFENNQLSLHDEVAKDINNGNTKNLYIKIKNNDTPLSDAHLLMIKNSIAKSDIISLNNTIENNQAITKTNELIDAAHTTKNSIEYNKHAIIKNESSISINQSNIAENTLKADQALGQNIIQDLSIEENKKSIILNSDEIAKNKINIIDNKNSIKDNNEQIEKHENHISYLENEYLTNLNIKEFGEKNIKDHFSSLYAKNSIDRENINKLDNEFQHFKSETNNRFYKVEKQANQGIASVAAMSNLPFTDSATFSTAIGVGNYRNATALAWGMQYRINENIKVKASTAWNDSNNWVSAGGVGISW